MASPSSREFDWKQDKEFRYNYGVRRDPTYKEHLTRVETNVAGSRLPARARLSFHKDSSASSQKESQSRTKTQTLRTEWRPVAAGSHIESSSKAGRSQVSHTPSSRPQREGGSSLILGTTSGRQRSGDSNPLSQERRSTLDRLSLPKQRVPLLQDGMANAESGRLKEVDIHYLEENLPILQSGANNIPSSSKNPVQGAVPEYNATQDRSPIRSLSEDRLHVSLRLGPLAISDEIEDNVAVLTSDKRLKSTISLGLQDGKGKALPPSPSRKPTVRSPCLGGELKEAQSH
ncbi:hypothetical protein F2Q69_00046099 [Brassica cretica]|uniref:Uncharacterized protein n=1 Tax=Brassica cretica TaxID=69181 RepID=A0A8S9Q243_BRACR|nr:hypothetical protein F2Q69_00046099 [Brassica cretica]